MASIVLSAVGQAVGTAVGGPIGGQIGAMAGARIGGAIDSKGSRKHHYEGARLENLAVQTSTYGRMIPIVYGTVRISGNVIWARPIREIATTTQVTSSGGKGGGAQRQSTTSTSYSYYVTLAIAMCEGEINRLDRVWADAKLLDLSQGTYRVYKGSETQLPDALIESYQGVGSTPAYRGRAYVVIEDFPLGDFGNRIPNFTFELTRRVTQADAEEESAESLVSSIMLIPGSGEFVYDPQVAYKIGGTDTGSGFAQTGYQTVLNQHTPEGKANVEVALDQLQETFPNLEWVGLAVNWFGTSMDIASCQILPAVEYQASGATSPSAWSVAGLTRDTAHQIGSDGDRLRYGGTPDDGSIVRLLDALAARGLKVFFYPQMLMDVAGKPWRGYLTGAASAVAGFFTGTHGYNQFILHYANLVAGKVDAFAIGTEMRDLTKISSSTGVFPAVSQFVSLASSVKAILGSGVKVTYAADWSEYHHTDGGWYHLDPLWASSSIDMVGIDAYFPLSDAVQSGYDIEALRDGWTSGEGYDWYYTDEDRTVQAALAPAYAWKNIAWWWSNAHVNPNGSTTAWVPESKPIWFSEYGFASVDGCANEPNVFIDSTTSGSALPRFSRGRVDFMAQRAAIAATELAWAGSSMVAQKFLWTWDARPYPYWPDLRSVWSDGSSWVTGHWVQGKLGASHVAAAVADIMRRAGLSETRFNASAVQAILDGFVLYDRVSARAAIDQLMQAFFFTIKESGGKLVLIPRDASVDAVIEADECVPIAADKQEVAYLLERKEDLVLPARMEVQFLNRLMRYESHIESASRATGDATDIETIRLSLVLSEAHAQVIAEKELTNRWAERSSVSFQLPIRYASLEPGDVVELRDGALTHRIRLSKVQIGRPGIVRVSGAIDAAEVNDGYISPVEGSDGSAVALLSPTHMELLDMPAWPTDLQDALTLRFAACGIAPGWTGATVSRVLDTGEDQPLLEISTPAVIGRAATVLANGVTYAMDDINSVDIALLGEAVLANATESAVLGGSNAAIIGDEVIQFMTATQLAPGVYRLSGLLRGRLGTEHKTASHAIGDRFVLLNDAVRPLVIPASSAGQSWNLRTTSFGQMPSAGTLSTHAVRGTSLKPYSPAGLSAVRYSGGNIAISWNRRTRLDGSLCDYIDVPLREMVELYEIAIYDGSTERRRWRVSSTNAVYLLADQTADFGSAPTSLTISVTQISGLVGPGTSLVATVPVDES